MGQAVNRRISEQLFAATRAELDAERANALGRIGRKIQDHHDRCVALAHQLDDPTAAIERDDLLARYREARAAFEQVRWEFLVHREALGLADHRWVDRRYPPPDRR